MPDTHKFVGGPQDGKHIAVPADTHYVNVAVADPLPTGWWLDPSSDKLDSCFHTVTYQRAKIAGSTQAFYVWVPTDWDGDRLIQELIDRA